MATGPALDPARPTPPPRIKPYKDFLTPQLHRSFCAAAGLSLVVCLAASFVLSTAGSWFWSWFPAGPAGLRALLLLIPCLAVFIVRIANLHVGARTGASQLDALCRHVGAGRTLHTAAWYAFSGGFFGEVYLWSRRRSPELLMVDPGQAYERARVNENPVFLRCLFLVLALSQAVLHLLRDYDRLDLAAAPARARERKNPLLALVGVEANACDDAASIPRAVVRLTEKAGTIVARSANLAVATLFIVNNVVYWLVLRQPAWKLNYFFARLFFSDLVPAAPPTGIVHLGRIVWQALTASFMLATLWETTNHAFDIFAVQPPLKKEQPLTTELRDARGLVLHKSNDPNGSLLTGLTSKKELIKAFAFWELHLICTRFDQRRKTIYTEVDRRDASTWSQICNVCLQQVQDVQERIETALECTTKHDEELLRKAPSPDPVGVPQEEAGWKKIADQQIIEDGDVFAPRKPDFFHTVGNMAKSVGQSPGAPSVVAVEGRKAIEWGASKVPAEYKQRLTPAAIERHATGVLADLLKTPAGAPFRQTFARRAMATVFGAPHSSQATVLHAAQALTALVVRSLHDDPFGQVQHDTARIIRTFTAAIAALHAYTAHAPPHWTDVDFAPAHRRAVPALHHLRAALAHALSEILLTFAPFAGPLGLTAHDLRHAHAAAAAAARSDDHSPRDMPPPPSAPRNPTRAR